MCRPEAIRTQSLVIKLTDRTPLVTRFSLDMYAVQTGTARDVSFLIDFLPAYLFPNGEKHVEEFFVTGVSLGGEFSNIIPLSSLPNRQLTVLP